MCGSTELSIFLKSRGIREYFAINSCFLNSPLTSTTFPFSSNSVHRSLSSVLGFRFLPPKLCGSSSRSWKGSRPLSRNRSAVVPRGEVLRRRQKGSRREGLVDRGRRGCDDGAAVLACRHDGCDGIESAIKGGATMLGRDRIAQRSVAVPKVRHGRLEMALGLGVRQGTGSCWPSWHRKKRNSDADGADKPCEALIACVRRQ